MRIVADADAASRKRLIAGGRLEAENYPRRAVIEQLPEKAAAVGVEDLEEDR